MQRENTYSKPWFIIAHFLWALIGMIWYRHLFFRCLGYHSLDFSKGILWALLAAFCSLGIVTEFSNRRNGLSIATNLLLGFGSYTALAYLQLKGTIIFILLCVATGISAVFALLVLSRKMPNHRKKRKVVRRRFVHVLCFSRLAFSAAVVILFLSFGLHAFLGEDLFRASVKPVKESDVSQQTISNNIDTILLLQDDLWAELSIEEKLNVLQVAANIEQRYLGIPFGMSVSAGNLSENELGEYNPKTHEITISIDCLLYQTSRDALVVLCHEAYHCYQHCVVNVYNKLDSEEQQLLLFYPAGIYAAEFENYDDGDDDIISYYLQQCEIDARKYGECGVEDYFDSIENHLTTSTP